jgi:sulfate permease, SulP family
MTLAVFVFMKKMSAIGETTIDLFPIRNLKVRKPCDLRDEFILPAEYLDQIYVKSFSGPVFFGFSQYLIDNLKELPPVKAIIFEMNRVPYLDQSAAHALELVFEYLRKNNIEVYLAHLNKPPLKILRAVGIVPGVVPEDHIYDHIFDCLQDLEEDFVFRKSKQDLHNSMA